MAKMYDITIIGGGPGGLIDRTLSHLSQIQRHML